MKKIKSSGQLKLSSPWEIYCSEMRELFRADDDIKVCPLETDDSGAPSLTVECVGGIKAECLQKLIGTEVVFGNVTLKVTVKPIINEDDEYLEAAKVVFSNNPIVRDIVDGVGPVGEVHRFVRFNPSILQFYADNLEDLNGFKSVLPSDACNDLFPNRSMYLKFAMAPINPNFCCPYGDEDEE